MSWPTLLPNTRPDMLAAIWEFLTVTLPGLARAWFAGQEFQKKNRDTA
jgi:hypothetical protein